MFKNDNLLEQLIKYHESDFYPFHMPGHKRRIEGGLGMDFPNPFSIDITEIDGFDNLHHPEGILKDSMEWAAAVYGADRLYYLVNGSSSGILSAICGTMKPGGKILMSRNCHKSAYHGIVLNRLEVEYVYPQFIEEYHLQGGIPPEDVKEILKEHQDIEAVFLVSPTYEGVVSDIKSIADIVHSFNKPLIVDEAHGAHFHFGDGFPQPAINLGADIVIQSLHKTLPSLTQTALLQIREGFVDVSKIEYYLQVFQSSSPSYVLMASIENCIRLMHSDGRVWMKEYEKGLKHARYSMEKLGCLKLLDRNLIGSFGIYDMDMSKIVISTVGCELDGVRLCDILRKEYHLEMEMCGPDYVIALSSVMDTQEGIKRLVKALEEIDGSMSNRGEIDRSKPKSESKLELKLLSQPETKQKLELKPGLKKEPKLESVFKLQPEPKSEVKPKLRHTEREKNYLIYRKRPVVKLSAAKAVNSSKKSVCLRDSEGEISGEFIYLYPPGIPVIVPGEVISKEILNQVLSYIRDGLPVQGLKDKRKRFIEVLDV